METRADAAPAETAAPVERRASVVEGWDEARAPTPGTAFWNAMPRATRADAREAEVTKTTSPLRVVHITAELAPIAKVGGLGDVVEGLARAHGKMGHAVTVILPFYSCLPTDKIDGLTHVMDYDVTKGRYQDGETRYFNFRTTAMRGRVNGIDVILLKPHDDERSNIFQGSKIYGGSYDEREAYLYFCRAAREFLIASGENPNIIHCHEWQACGFPMIFWGLRDAYGQDCDGMSNAKIMLTIHNLDSNGEARQEEFCATGVDASMFATVDKALDERTIGHNPERLCLLKGASCIRITSPRCLRRTRRKFSPAVADSRGRISLETSTSLAGFSTESIRRVGPRATIRSYRTAMTLPTSSRKRRCAKSICSAD